MRVLWVCNIMLPVIARQLHIEASNKEGWLSGLAAVVLERQRENGTKLAVAFPVPAGFVESAKIESGKWEFSAVDVSDGIKVSGGEITVGQTNLRWYGFVEEVLQAHIYDSRLEPQMRRIVDDFRPDVVHCFGTEYPHTLAMCRVFPEKNRLLVGIQGICEACARAYYADLPEKVIRSITLRDILKRDSIRQQKEKFELRARTEKEILQLAGNVTGRTAWDRKYTTEQNKNIRYFNMDETLRPEFYEGEWQQDECVPHSIFLSQGDYPLKGLHYMLLALPEILAVYPDAKVYVAGNSIVNYCTLKDKLKISAYGRYLRKLIGQNGLEGKVQFLGRLDVNQMKAQYLKSNLFACCSSVENSPNSLGEAMLLGVPCVSADVGGISSIFTGESDGILFEKEDGLEENASNLAKAVIKMWSDPKSTEIYKINARKHAEETHDREKNYRRLMEIYAEIAGESTETPRIVFASNYINHHQIPFCNAMYEHLSGAFAFIQTEPMEAERVRMGWRDGVELPYVRRFYDEPEECRRMIKEADVVIFGGTDDESYIEARLQSGRPVLRYSERLYKEGQWKAVSPRGLLKKYHDHTRYRDKDVYLLCAGAYVASDFHIVRAYPGKMLQWGYFPETRHYDVDRLMAEKKPASILWAARFLDWKHPELAIECARGLREKGIRFHMDIVGDGEQRPMVERFVKEYGLSECVTLCGYRNPDEVRKMMEKADIFLATSDRKEGWGAVINEAMNSGCAVIAGHMMGAAPYLLRHGENGFIFRDGDGQMLLELTERLLLDRGLCETMGRAAIAKIEQEWNAEIATVRLLQFCVRKGFLRAEKVSADGVAVSDGSSVSGENPVPGRFSMSEESLASGPCAPAKILSERADLWKNH